MQPRSLTASLLLGGLLASVLPACTREVDAAARTVAEAFVEKLARSLEALDLEGYLEHFDPACELVVHEPQRRRRLTLADYRAEMTAAMAQTEAYTIAIDGVTVELDPAQWCFEVIGTARGQPR